MPYQADQQGDLKHKTSQAWQVPPREEQFLVLVGGALAAPCVGESTLTPGLCSPPKFSWLSAAPVAEEVVTLLEVSLEHLSMCRCPAESSWVL